MNSCFYSIELTYYFTAFLYEVIVSFSVSTNSSNGHAYDHACSPNYGSKNKLTLEGTLHSSITSGNSVIIFSSNSKQRLIC